LKIVLHRLPAWYLISVHEIAVGAQLAMDLEKTGPIRIYDRMPSTVETNGWAMVDRH
jgi:hypothetical protein